MFDYSTPFYRTSQASWAISSFAYSGTSSIQWIPSAGSVDPYSLLFFNCASGACFSSTTYGGVSMWVYATVAGIEMQLAMEALPSNDQFATSGIFASVPANTWTQVSIL
jgi:hypothetical protein